jgi:hypothetical protein
MIRPRATRAVAVILITVVTLASPARAQQRTGRGGQETRPPGVATPAPVALVRQGPTDYLSGEANVTVRGNQNPVVRLGMAQNGVTIVEFPAADRFFAVHPGNEDLVTVEKSPSRATDHHLVLRPGSGFVVPVLGAKGATTPATSIIAQMRSGLVITLMIYPVGQLAQQAHRCVISYRKEEVIAARKAAGLATGLGEVEPAPTPKPQETAAAPQPTAKPAPTPEPSVGADPAPVVVEVEPKAKRQEGVIFDPRLAAKNALAEAVKEPKRFRKWTAPRHGLSVSLAQPRDVNARSRLVVIAVRNTKGEAMRIVPGQPELFVETTDGRGARLQIEQARRLLVETTALDGAIPAGATVYYALVYEPPILGARQHLRVAVGQTNAADEPASADLAAGAR